jgi:hypothetical protein
MESLFRQTLVGGLLLLSGCDVLQSARNDLNQLTTSNPLSPQSTSRASQPAAAVSRPAAAPASAAKPGTGNEPAKAAPAADVTSATSIDIIGKNENEVRAMLGPPTTVEERAPGKTWRYRDGQCTFAVQLYPDVQTRQFGTLAYEVKSDDNTDQGNRACMVQLHARTQSHG